MKIINKEEYFKGSLNYTYSDYEKTFKHNIEKDFHLFIVWEGGLDNIEGIASKISSKFNILFRANVQWSKGKISENISRFYKIDDVGLIDTHCNNKARDGLFHCIIVEDKNPKYSYRQNISGPIRLVNINNLTIKREIRSDMQGNFFHSSSCPEEFFEQIYLLFNQMQVSRILNNPKNRIENLQQDLVGSTGWDDFNQFFNVMNKCSNYLVQRNFEYLPNDFFENDKDVDVLCDDFLEFALASNAKGIKGNSRTVYFINICQSEVQFDIRSVDGKYYDPAWIGKMLSSKEIFKDIVFKPNIVDYFFSLTYHATIQKSSIKEIYIKRLKDISNEMNFDFISIDFFYSNEEKAKLISGYLKANNYKVSKPVDETVYLNRGVLQFIDSDLIDFKFNSTIELYRKIVPIGARKIIPTSLKKFIKKII